MSFAVASSSVIDPHNPQNNTIKELWDALSIQMTSTNPVIVIPIGIFQHLFSEVRSALLEKYESIQNVQALYARDANVNRVFLSSFKYFEAHELIFIPGDLPIVFLQRPGQTLSHATKNETLTAVQAKKIPRPPNAFIIYRRHHHSNVVAINPGVHNNQISVIIGRMWAAEEDHIRAQFKLKSEHLKAEHARLYPGYTYQPRRPHQKKKRMSKNKAALKANAKNLELTSDYASLETDGDITNTTIQEREEWEYNQRVLSLPMSQPKLAYALMDDSMGRPAEPISDDTGYYKGTAGGTNVGPAAIYRVVQQNDMKLISDYTSRFVRNPSTTSRLKRHRDPVDDMSGSTGEHNDAHEWDLE